MVKWTWKGLFYLFIFWVGLESWEGLAWGSETNFKVFWDSNRLKMKKKKRRVRSAIAFWPDKAPFCGIINEEYWPGTLFSRQGGMVLVGDSPYRIFRMVSTISSINSGSGLQLQEHPQLLLLLLLLFLYKKNGS